MQHPPYSCNIDSRKRYDLDKVVKINAMVIKSLVLYQEINALKSDFKLISFNFVTPLI